jgi:hypothetical protein
MAHEELHGGSYGSEHRHHEADKRRQKETQDCAERNPQA